MVVANFATTKDYGRRSGFTQTREIDYYNLEMITSIGYRVKSRHGKKLCAVSLLTCIDADEMLRRIV